MDNLWCVARWDDGSALGPDYTVGPHRADRDPGTIVRRFQREYIARDADGCRCWESSVQVLDRAQALADALNDRGAHRERMLRNEEGAQAPR